MGGMTRVITNDKRLEGVVIGDASFKLSHFADDKFAWILNFIQEQIFDRLLGIFFLASNMRENYSKREKLGLCPLASKQPKDLPGAKWDPHTTPTLRHTAIQAGPYCTID